MRRNVNGGLRRWGAIAIAAALFVAAPAGAVCTGDCNANDVVAVNEVVTMVNVSLATQPLSACTAGDANQNGAIAINELMTAVNHALTSCAAANPNLQPCTGAKLTACSAACGGPGRDGCCTLSSPPGCFDATNGSINFTQCGAQPSAACVLVGVGVTPTPTAPGGATPTITVPAGATPTGTPVAGAKTQVSIVNQTANAAMVYISFAADSAITQGNWASFCSGSGRNCQFSLPGNGTQALPNPSGAYLNFTTAFNSPVGCGATKAEVNVNNPSWYDILDVSLVDGYTNNVAIVVTQNSGTLTTLGPPNGQNGNESVYGLYPYGCDVCVARCSPPCGIAKSNPLLGCDGTCNNCQGNGTDGCKTGTQTSPTVPCQYQGTQLGGGGESVRVVLMN